VQIWDLRQPRPTLSLAAHQFEILSADWCKYNDCIIATGSVDKSIKVGGCRSCACVMLGIPNALCQSERKLQHLWPETHAGLFIPFLNGMIMSPLDWVAVCHFCT
jgi:hypothetical protein